jgi:hypothetical protein
MGLLRIGGIDEGNPCVVEVDWQGGARLARYQDGGERGLQSCGTGRPAGREAPDCHAFNLKPCVFHVSRKAVICTRRTDHQQPSPRPHDAKDGLPSLDRRQDVPTRLQNTVRRIAKDGINRSRLNAGQYLGSIALHDADTIIVRCQRR